MKYLKSFNEELNPQTYRNASSKLSYYGKQKSSDALYDFADEKQYGFYNAVVCKGQSMPTKDAKLTQPELSGIYSGNKAKDGNDNLLKWGKDIENELNILVEKWKAGDSNLSLQFEFSFRATRQTKNVAKSLEQMYIIPFIILEVRLSEFEYGIEEWDAEASWENEEFTPSTLSEMFEYSKEFSVYTQRPISDLTYGLFNDRQSAQKFKSFVNSIVDEKMKPHIMEVLSIVGGTSQDLENILNSIRNIRIHGLYQSDVTGYETIKNLYDKQL
jgi:hypothetical protein